MRAIDLKKSVLVFVLCICTITVLRAQFSGGTGAENNPYIITTWKELEQIPSYRDRHFKLGNDLDYDNTAHFGGYVKPAGGWTSLCTQALPFTGTFDGNNKTISNIQMTYGLFFMVSGINSCIKNLKINGQMTITNAVLYGTSYQGGSIARIMNVGSVVNCESSVNITGIGTAGGFVGVGTANISYCINRGNISVAGGGIAGECNTVAYCTNYGNILINRLWRRNCWRSRKCFLL